MTNCKQKIIIFFVFLNLMTFKGSYGQGDRKKVLEGNLLYSEQKYDEAFLKYRDAAISNPESPAIHYNMGNALYKKKNYDESVKEYEKSLGTDEVLAQANIYYNLGNVMYRQNKLLEAIQYYQKTLKLNPGDQDAKYNLEYVRRKIKNEADKQKQNPNQQQQQQQQQEQKGQEQNEEQKQQEQEQDQPEQKEQQEQQAAEPQQLSKEDAERILDALKDDEKNAREQDKKQVRGRGRSGKDW